MFVSQPELAAGIRIFKRSLFGQLTNTLVSNSLGHVVRMHATEETSSNGKRGDAVRFGSMPRGSSLALSRYLQMADVNAHAVVSDVDMVDLFFDVENQNSLRRAAETSLGLILLEIRRYLARTLEVTLEEVDERVVQKVLVLDASAQDGQKQSMHIHVRLDKPIGSRTDVRVATEDIRKALPGSVGDWLDMNPARSGSLRVMYATTVGKKRPLRPLNLARLTDPTLKKYLEEKCPESDELMMEMALLKRFPTDEDGVYGEWSKDKVYTFKPVLDPLRRQARGKEFKAETKDFCALDAINSGSLADMVDALPLEAACNYNEWHHVLWCLKSIVSQESHLDEDVYEIFDSFSAQSSSNYTPEQNRRSWNSYKKTATPAAGYFSLKKLAKQLA
eukprot:Rhum_TRINITY_DN13688_c2_g1::Rhum_TRINITY_DN13688_c2_g1_i1::g.62966::m.62966